MPDLKDIILGNVAIERGLVTRESLLDLQKQQRDTGLPLGQVMLRAGVVTGPRLIELMKLVNVTIQHLDGGMEVGVDTALEIPSAVPAARPVNPPDPSAEPARMVGPDGIPFAPVYGGGKAPSVVRTQPDAAPPPAAPAARRSGTQTPGPIPSPLGDPAAVIPSPLGDSPQMPASTPAADPRRPSMATPKPVNLGPMARKPKSEAFDPGRAAPPARPPSVLQSSPSGKPGTARFAGPPSAGPAKPKTESFAARFGGPPPEVPAKPKTQQFVAKSPGKTPTEAFRAQLQAGSASAAPQEAVTGAFGENISGAAPAEKKDKSRLYQIVELPQQTPAGKLPAEGEEAAEKKEGSISVPPAAGPGRGDLKPVAATPAGRIARIDAESRPIPSPLDDSKVLKDLPPFEMPPGATAETAPPPSGQRHAPAGKPGTRRFSAPPAAPGSGLPTARTTGQQGRMMNPDDSGFVATTNVPDFVVNADSPRKGTGVVGKASAGKQSSAGRAGLPARAKEPAEAGAGSAGSKEDEAPKKRSKKLLVFLLIFVALELGAGGALLGFKKVAVQDFKALPQTIKEAPELLRQAPELLKELFKGPPPPPAGAKTP